jgi:hypothetical protein
VSDRAQIEMTMHAADIARKLTPTRGEGSVEDKNWRERKDSTVLEDISSVVVASAPSGL